MDTTETLSIRRLVPSDAATYRAMMLEAYEHHPDAFTSSVAERAALPPSWWLSRLAQDESAAEVVFGAVDAGDLVGVAGLMFETREKARHKATLFGMYVPPRARSRGIGRHRVEAALAFAVARPRLRARRVRGASAQLVAEDLSGSRVANCARGDSRGSRELLGGRLSFGAVEMIQDGDALEMPSCPFRQSGKRMGVRRILVVHCNSCCSCFSPWKRDR